MTKRENSAAALDAWANEQADRLRQRLLERDRTLDQAISAVALDDPMLGLALQSIVTELREHRKVLEER